MFGLNIGSTPRNSKSNTDNPTFLIPFNLVFKLLIPGM